MALLRAAVFAPARAGRYLYWKITIASWLIGVIAGWLAIRYDWPLIVIITLAVVHIYISLAVSVARCRDAGIPTWVAWYVLTPGIGVVYLIYWGTIESEPVASEPTRLG